MKMKRKVHINVEVSGLSPEENLLFHIAVEERIDEVMEFLGYKESEVK